MINILQLEGWTDDGELNFTKEDSSLRALEIYASELHTGVEVVNSSLKKSEYIIDTLITGEDNKYDMIVKIQYYGKKSEHEHQKNSHRQEIDI